MSEERQILINFIAGLSLADHMGDVTCDAETALEKIGIFVPDDGEEYDSWLSMAANYLSREHAATTLYGTSLLEDDGDD